MNRNNYLVSIIIVNYKDYIFLRNCLASLKSAADKNTEIIVVDNESDFSAAEKIKKEFEEIKLYSLTENLNYAGGNNFGIAHSHGDFIVILNNDTIVESNWLSPLVDAGLKNYNALYQPKIVFLEKPETINSFGNTVHLFGFAFPIGIDRSVSDMMKDNRELHRIFYCSGACIFTSRKVIDKLGGFDSNYWTYYEDVNLGWKANLYGFPSYIVPVSTIYHRWGVSHGQILSSEKFFLLERGRLSTILRNFSLRSLLIIFPFILMLDALIVLYLLPKRGMLGAKVKASKDIMTNWRNIYNERKKLQRIRIKNDRDISLLFSTSIDHPYINMPIRAKRLLVLVSDKLRMLL